MSYGPLKDKIKNELYQTLNLRYPALMEEVRNEKVFEAVIVEKVKESWTAEVVFNIGTKMLSSSFLYRQKKDGSGSWYCLHDWKD